MKKSSVFKLIVLAAFIFASIIFVVFMGPFIKKTPEQYIKEKYVDDSSYSLILHRKNANYEGILGEDHENIYLDLFSDGDYFGESFIPKNENYIYDTVQVYQFQQYETLLVVFGYNLDSEYTSYILKIAGTTVEPKSITKEIKSDKYILDIYTLDTKYNFTANIEFTKT